MKRPLTCSTFTEAAPPTPGGLLRDFGVKTALAREGVRALSQALDSDGRSAMDDWRAYFGRWAGRALDKRPQHLARLAGRYGLSTDVDATMLLFALQTYYVLVVKFVAGRFGHGDLVDALPNNPFSWYASAQAKGVERLLDRMTDTAAAYRIAAPAEHGDLFKPLYQNLFPRPLRHQLGEYYTPDWLARHVLDQVGYTGEPDQRLLDPACGSGTFLLLALRRWRQQRTKGGHANLEQPLPPGPPSFPVVGFDLNPLAVMTARANYLIAMADLLPDGGHVEVPVYLGDSILGDGEQMGADVEPFDFVVGNPPWIAWDNLPDEDRQATKPLWERYGLFTLSGNEARHGGGKKDLSTLMLYATADRYLKPGGRLGMVITQTLFQTKGAGDGFRRFQLGPEGPRLKVLRVDDMVALQPFDAANWTSTLVLQKGAATEYPVPYFKWERGLGSEENVQPTACLASPIDSDHPTSPWWVQKRGQNSFSDGVIRPGPSDYTAHLGANSGGANGVYWVELLGKAEGGVRIRNIVAKSKRRVDVVEWVIEPDLLYPLLRWGDVRRCEATPRCCILLAQNPATRSGIEEAVMQERYPRTLAYLEQFHDLLVSRAAYQRYQKGGPFHAMYNVGPYTTAPIKVVWRRMDRRINAVVVEEIDDPLLGRRPVIPQETCVLLACDSADEAHYICAVLNGPEVNELVAAYSVRGGKGFGSPGMLNFIALRRFQPDNPQHVARVLRSRRAHAEHAASRT